MNIIFDIIGAVVLSQTVVFATSSIMKISFLKKSHVKYMLSIILIAIYLILSYYFCNALLIRYLLFIFVTALVIAVLFKERLKETFVASFFTWILAAVSELLFALLLNFVFHAEMSELFGQLICNIGISIILLIIVNSKKIIKSVRNILSKTISSNSYYVFIICLILALAVSIIMYINYFNLSATISITLSIIVVVIYTIITMILFSEKSNKNKIKYEYETILRNLEEYENMLDFQRVANHENKNQLLVIKGMIQKNENDIIDYIDSIVKDKNEDNEEFLYRTNYIPSGGLRGLVYYKVLAMKDKKINVSLNISNSIRKCDFEKFGVDMNKDICKIMGVILDNSMQAVENLDERKICIEMRYDNNIFTISVSNNFNGYLDASKLDNVGYTTKGDGHGYGLALLKKIVDSNVLIDNNKIINGNVFTQLITIKMN